MVIIVAVTLVTVVNAHAAVPNEKCKAQAGVLQFPLAWKQHVNSFFLLFFLIKWHSSVQNSSLKYFRADYLIILVQPHLNGAVMHACDVWKWIREHMQSWEQQRSLETHKAVTKTLRVRWGTIISLLVVGWLLAQDLARLPNLRELKQAKQDFFVCVWESVWCRTGTKLAWPQRESV